MDVTAVSAAFGAQAPAAALPETHTASAPAPASNAHSLPDQQQRNAALIGQIAKLFGQPESPQSVGLSVSYRVLHNPNEIVTVFSDPATGKEVAQFPAEIVVQIAQFFDKQSGVTLDRTA
jgi:uncharacterized FlaG/YvyC family protein